jgi:hypothetical protein
VDVGDGACVVVNRDGEFGCEDTESDVEKEVDGMIKDVDVSVEFDDSGDDSDEGGADVSDVSDECDEATNGVVGGAIVSGFRDEVCVIIGESIAGNEVGAEKSTVVGVGNDEDRNEVVGGCVGCDDKDEKDEKDDEEEDDEDDETSF